MPKVVLNTILFWGGTPKFEANAKSGCVRETKTLSKLGKLLVCYFGIVKLDSVPN